MCAPNREKVHKCPLPGPLYTTKEDVSSLEMKPGSRPRCHGKLSTALGQGLGIALRILLAGRALTRCSVPAVEGLRSTRDSGCSTVYHVGTFMVLSLRLR